MSNADQVLEVVIATVQRYVPLALRDQMRAQTLLFDGSLDSLGVLNVVADLETHFAITFLDEDLQEEKIQSPAHIRDVVLRYLNNRSGAES